MRVLNDLQTVYCLIPTYNRLALLKNTISLLKEQTYEYVYSIVVNDGSSDGTNDYLREITGERIKVVEGDGNLWWGGAIHLGMNHITTIANDGDYILLLNDDVEFNDDYIFNLVKKSQECNNAIIGSAQYSNITKELIGTGFLVNYLTMNISVTNSINVDAFFGRGTLIPLKIIKEIGFINSRYFKQHLCDIEFTVRAKEKGCRLVVSSKAKIFTNTVSSDQYIRDKGLFYSIFHSKSSNNIIQRIIFFLIRGTMLYRITAIPRCFIMGFYQLIIKLMNK